MISGIDRSFLPSFRLCNSTMRSHTYLRAKGSGKVNPQQVIFELKHRAVLALNKLADRDTYQIGADELERIAESLTPEGILPFLSCIVETDSEQKSSVRKECVRIMGTLATIHGALLDPHLGKIVGSIVKRLKDPDSVVRDACMETMGVLASKLRNHKNESDGSFVVLVKPFFEALGDQNKQVQSGSALCLAKVIDQMSDPPLTLLVRMLSRVIKLLKNQHFMAKPALVELVRSIVQAGGASTGQALSAAVTSIQDALKSSDWATRKAASVALASIASNGGSFLSSFKSSCILSLESCRFDKVKPVRDSVMQAIQNWKCVSGSDYPEPSEAGSSIKENFCRGDYADVSSVTPQKVVCSATSGTTSSTMKRTPLAVRKTCLNYAESPHPKTNDWHIEVALPKMHSVSLAETNDQESEGSCITKILERNVNSKNVHGIGYDYMPMADKPESSSLSDIVSSHFESKVTAIHSCQEESDSAKVIGMDCRYPAKENDSEVHICSSVQDRSSMASTVTEPRSSHGSCLHTINELAFIRNKLLEIESKQSNLLDLIQAFIGNSMGSISMLQTKVLGLEYAVDKISRNLTHIEHYSNMTNLKGLKNNQSVSSSSRVSTCTPRPSMDTTYRQPLFPSKSRETWGETALAKSRTSASIRHKVDMWRDPTLNIIKNPIANGVKKNIGYSPQSPGSCQSRKAGDLSVSVCTSNPRQNIVESNSSLWKHVKEFLSMGDLETAYLEALCSGDNLILFELMGRTGPVLERLSSETVTGILSTIVAHLLDQRSLELIIPWLHQVVELSVSHESNHLPLSGTARRELLSAIEEAAAFDFCDPADRRSIKQLMLKFRQIWGRCS